MLNRNSESGRPYLFRPALRKSLNILSLSTKLEGFFIGMLFIHNLLESFDDEWVLIYYMPFLCQMTIRFFFLIIFSFKYFYLFGCVRS